MIGEARQRPLALEPQRGRRLVQRGAVLLHQRDVLAETVGAGADQAHVRGHPGEVVGEDRMQAVVLARFDDERQARQPRPQRGGRRHSFASAGLSSPPAHHSPCESVSRDCWSSQCRRRQPGLRPPGRRSAVRLRVLSRGAGPARRADRHQRRRQEHVAAHPGGRAAGSGGACGPRRPGGLHAAGRGDG